MSYNTYYLPCVIDANINYLYLLYFYGLAYEQNKNSKLIKSTIKYKSASELTEQINAKFDTKQDNAISVRTIERILNDKEYLAFWDIDKKNKIITLHNNFVGNTVKQFIKITPNMYNLIFEKQDKLLARYIVYMVYACGISHNKTNFTANQFLSAIGYSQKNNQMKEKISTYNDILDKRAIISIQHYTDENNMKRCYYSLL